MLMVVLLMLRGFDFVDMFGVLKFLFDISMFRW